jgi:FdhE protein
VTVDARRVRRVLQRTLKDCPTEVDVVALLAASMRHDNACMVNAARAVGVDEDAFQSVAALLAVPLLQACERRWAPAVGANWVEGYCPVCGSWPAFAEVCGIERNRCFRCGRCGGSWHARQLVCAYCGTVDHNELTTLVPERAGSHAAVEACTRCNGYVKTFTRLQACTPGMVMLDDLASVDLDVAALELGYSRPTGPGRAFDVTVREAGGGIFRWRP